MSWLFLLMAILFEISGTTCMKLSEGFTRMFPSVLIFVFYALSICCLTLALRRIEVSIAYAIWAGVGTALIALIGIVWFYESVSLLKIGSLVLIILGVVGLNLVEPDSGATARPAVEMRESAFGAEPDVSTPES